MANMNIRVADELKQQAEIIFSEFGLSTSSAITVFLKQVVRVGGLPFDLRDPFYSAENQARLQKSMERMEAGQGTEHELIDNNDLEQEGL